MVKVSGIKFQLDKAFTAGTYKVSIRDITKSIKNKMVDIDLELVITDPMLEAEKAAAEAAASKDAKKGGKKK